jgi:PAS domain-containing protein
LAYSFASILKKIPMSLMPDNLVPNKENEGRFQRLLEASLDPLVTISLDGKIMDFNKALANITGVTREDLNGLRFLSIILLNRSKPGKFTRKFLPKVRWPIRRLLCGTPMAN